MRIVGGKFGGRVFNPPAKNWPTRPTTDISKEALFNILHNTIDFEETRMLDLFGGTGNHCYEFISRGCSDATYVDQHYPAIKFVKKTAALLDIEEELKVVKMDVARFLKLKHEAYDYIFAGPPYPLPWLDKIPNLILDSELLAAEGILVLEHNPQHNFEDISEFWKSKKYGQTIFSFFQK